MKLRAPLVAAGMLALGSLATVVTGSAAAVPIAFTHEVTVDPNRMNGEPDVAIADNGREMYTSGPWGFSTTVSMAWKSEDAGVQWDSLHGSCPTNPLRPFCSRGGGDSEVELGTPQGTGNTKQTAYFGDLNGLDTITCAYSTNGGDTFTVSDAGNVAGNACNLPVNNPTAPGSDRQWIAVWRTADQPNGATIDKLFMVFDTGDTPPGDDGALMSTDGGHTWVAACQGATDATCVRGANGFGTRPGPLLINPHVWNTINQATYPTLYEFMGTNSTGPEVNISCDGGQTWTSELIDPTSTAGGLAITNDFVVGAMDTGGGLYTAWAQQSSNGTNPWQIFYSHSTDSSGSTGIGNCTTAVQGKTWSTRVAITGPGGSNTGVNYGVMPAIAAGDPGRVDIAYYGDSVDHGINPASTNPMTWYLHMSQSLNGNSTASFTDVLASETPMHVHSICFSGLDCMLQVPAGDRNLIDFFEVRPDPTTGRAVIQLVDDNNTQPGPPGANPGAGTMTAVQQASGPSLFSSVGNVPALPAQGLGQSTDVRQAGVNATVTDPTGDALLPGHQPAPGPNVDAADITKVSVTMKDANTMAMTFTVKNLAACPNTTCPLGGATDAIVNNAATAAANELHTGAIWLATWHFNNDLWFASANVDNSGTLTCLAGKPLDVFSSSAPKALQYVQGSGNKQETGCSATGNKIEVDVPFADVGNPSELFGFTGFTADTSASSATTGITGGTAPGAASGSAGFLDAIDQAAPLDVVFSSKAVTPEAVTLPLLLGTGGAALAAVAVIRRRRPRDLSR